MADEGLCLELIAGGKVCALPMDHAGDHDPDLFRGSAQAQVRAEREAGELADRVLKSPTGTQVRVVETRCSQCGGKIEMEFPTSRLGDSIAKMMLNDPTMMCEGCADLDAQQSGEDDERELIESRRAASGMPSKWQRQRLTDLEDDELRSRAIELASEWALEETPGVVLWGDVGCGKTAIAAAAANAMLVRRRVRWVAVSELLIGLRMPFDTPEYARALRALDPGRGGAGLAALVLDDLDKLKPTEHAVQPLYTAVNAWIEAEAPLLVTLNRRLSELAEWLPDTFGDAITSRLSGYCKVREVRGVDRRLS